MSIINTDNEWAKVETAMEEKCKDPAEGFFVMAGVPVTMANAYAGFARAQRQLGAGAVH